MLDYIDKEAMAFVVDFLRGLCMTKRDGEAVYNALSALAETVVFPAASLTIPSSGWKTGTDGAFAVYIDVSAAGVTAADSVTVTLSSQSIEAARACGLCPMVETLSGVLRFRALSAPKTSMTGQYRILRGPASKEA